MGEKWKFSGQEKGSLEPDGDTQPLFCRQRNCLGIPTGKQHDGIYFQQKSSGNTVADRVRSDKSQAGSAVVRRVL